jgi:tetratricopeptide (TPR) repeat protein
MPYFSLKGIRKWPGPLVLIGAGALIIRLIYFAELSGTPVLAVIIGDAKQYDSWAQQIAGGQWMGSEVFYQTPFYPYLLAVIFKLTGHHLFTVRVAQAILGASSCVLLGFAGRRFFDQSVGLIAAALLAIYPPAIFFDGLIQKSSVDLFLMTLILVVLGEFLRRPHWKWQVVAGVVLGAFTLNRENGRIFYPIIAVWLLIYFRSTPFRSRVAWAAIFTAAIALVLLPVGFRNYHVGGEFIISTSQLGTNLYIGNHPGAEGAYEPLVPGHGNAAYERDDARRLAEEAMGRKLSASEVSDYWVRRSFDYMRNQPADWLKLMSRKLLLTFSAREAVDTESIEAYSEYSRVLRMLLWITFGIILPLGVLGAWLTRHECPRLAVLYAMLLGMAVAVSTFYVVARYRYPIVPIVMLFAAAALAAIREVRRQRWRHWLPGLLMAVAVAIPSNFLWRNSNDETFLNIGEELVRLNRTAEAIPLLQKAVNTSPGYAPSHFNLGVAFNQAGQKEQALDEFAAAINVRPDYFEAHAAMALTLLETGRPIGAVEHFREALRLRPDMAGAYSNLGNALVQAGHRPEAIVEYREALRLDPDSATTHNSLAVALQQEGMLEEAIQHYDAALKLQPDDAGAHSNLALALDAKGNHDSAIEQFNKALQLQPGNAAIHVNLADLLIRLGRIPEAISHYEQAATLASDSLEMHFQLAEAYARAGRSSEALSSFERALAIAQAAGRNDEAEQIAEAIRLCQSGMMAQKPLRPRKESGK